MIEINLLPLELREKKRIALGPIFKARIILAVLGSLILLHLFLHTLTVISAGKLDNLKRQWQDLSPRLAQINQLKKEFAKFDAKIPLIEQLISHRVLWSKKLNRISDLIIDGIWLNEITLEQKKAEIDCRPLEYLIIQGSAASRTKDEPALIGRFMQSLKDDPLFSEDFAEIELGPIKKKQISQTEIMDFTLVCRFKPDKAQFLFR
jgi:Tfp pilus assembly protein PilN